jgi:hypothetical protein
MNRGRAQHQGRLLQRWCCHAIRTIKRKAKDPHRQDRENSPTPGLILELSAALALSKSNKMELF